MGCFGFSDEVRDPARLVHGEDAHPARLRQRHPPDGQRDVRALAAMERHERLVVHLVDVVAGQDHDSVARRLVEHVEVLEDRVGRAPVPVVRLAAPDVGLQDPDAAPVPVQVPRPPEPDVVVEGARVVLRQDHDVVDVRVDAVAQREVDDPVLAAERDGRLGPLLREDREARTFAAREDHRQGPLHARILVTSGERVPAIVASAPVRHDRRRASGGPSAGGRSEAPRRRGASLRRRGAG